MAIAISGKTKILCVIGDPIEHTMSPAMHNAAIQALGLELVYVAFHVKQDQLKQAFDGFRALGILGINVTIPHKINVMQYLDDIDPVAKGIGAVNTVKNIGGKLHGRNTDADGAAQALKNGGVVLKASKIALIGAGGAARAVGFALVREGSNVTILARHDDVPAAADIVRDIKILFPSGKIDSCELGKESMDKVMPGANVVINATPVGMHPNANQCIIDATCFHSGMHAFDLVYNPHDTLFLKHAQSAGCKVVHGIDMLAHQGAMAFEWWTGTKPPVDIMRDAAIKVLSTR
nr:shikimate dehydrogenase [Candidatus Sigynarchaeota archaeon]